MDSVISRSPDPQFANALKSFADAPTALVMDALMRLNIIGAMDDVAPIMPASHMVGRARIARYAPTQGVKRPTQSIFAVIRSLEPGDVLVMESGGTLGCTIGGNIALCAEAQGLAGLVTDGRCRDFAAMGAMKLPVFSRGPGVRPPAGLELADLDVAVTCAGAQIRPGDLLIGDRDGVAVVAASRVGSVIHQVEELIELEDELAHLIKTKAPLDEIAKVQARRKTARPA